MKLLNNILTITISALGLISCDDFLEDDTQFRSEEEIITSGVRSRGLIDDIYKDYDFEFTSDYNADYYSNDAVRSTQTTPNTNSNWNGLATNHPFNDVWATSYDNIRIIYDYLTLVHQEQLPFYEAVITEGLSPTIRESLEAGEAIVERYYGEAFFLKAWSQWLLLKTYGGESEGGGMLGFPIVDDLFETTINDSLIFVDTFKNEDFLKLERNTYEECVDNILDDLDVAIEYLPLTYNGNVDRFNTAGETGRASGLAAYALKAKVALYAASPAFNTSNDIQKWEKAAEYAHDFIEKNGGLRNLSPIVNNQVDNPDHIWRGRTTADDDNPNDNNPDDNSLEINQFPPTLYGQGATNPSQNLVDAFPDSNGFPIEVSSIYDSSNPYSSRDPRFYKNIFYNGDKCFNSESCDQYNALEMFKGGLDNFGGFQLNRGTRTGYYLKKFLNNYDINPSNETTNGTGSRAYVQIDLTEMYLIYAEAVVEAYGQANTAPVGLNYSAKDVLSRVRLRAGYSSDSYLSSVQNDVVLFKELLKNERRIELCFTGERFHDLRRWKEIDQIENIKGINITKQENGTFIYESIDVENRSFQEKNYYIPLPYSELLLNSNLKQNKGWAIN